LTMLSLALRRPCSIRAVRLPKVREAQDVINALNMAAARVGVCQHEALRQILTAAVAIDGALNESALGFLDGTIAPCWVPVSLADDVRRIAQEKQVSRGEVIRRALRHAFVD